MLMKVTQRVSRVAVPFSRTLTRIKTSEIYRDPLCPRGTPQWRNRGESARMSAKGRGGLSPRAERGEPEVAASKHGSVFSHEKYIPLSARSNFGERAAAFESRVVRHSPSGRCRTVSREFA